MCKKNTEEGTDTEAKKKEMSEIKTNKHGMRKRDKKRRKIKKNGTKRKNDKVEEG